MKQFYTIIFLLISLTTFAQIPAGYYDTATGTGYTLKTQLHNIIDDHNDQGYDAIDAFIGNYDLDNYYETTSNTILDIYSENPTGNDPYNFTPVTDECGEYDSEGDCYNKEHVIPQSFFNSNSPMRGDAHQLLPSDGRVNGFRNNAPYGRVDDSQLSSQSGISNPTQNGSKLGNNLNSGYSAGYSDEVFEPIDEFKGDIARIYFYFVTRYEDQISAWSAYEMFDGSSDKAIADPFLNILRIWHEMDPVSQKEIDRNNNIYYNHQGNRNPFVDHPEWVATVWDTDPDTESPTAPTNLVASNPTFNSIDLDWNASTDNIGVVGYNYYIDDVYSATVLSTTPSNTVLGLSPNTTYCFKITAIDAAGNESAFSNEACETTLENTNLLCIDESFENMPASSSSYSDRNWTGDDGYTWAATDARTDQTLNGSRAITIRNGELILNDSNFPIEELTVTTQRVFSGDSGTFDLVINGNVIGTIPYGDSPVTTTIPCNINNVVDLSINNNSNPSNRVMFDDLKWTCFLLSNEEFTQKTITIYPNPVSGNHITVNTTESLDFEIYNLLGKLTLKGTSQNGQINVANLTKGIYLIKLKTGNRTITKKLIKQ